MAQHFEIPGYTIYEKIGTGSIATVWHARQDAENRKVAIKVIQPELWKRIEDIDVFFAEIQAVADLTSRHIVNIYDAGLLNNTAYIVFEHIDGETIADYLKQNQKIAPDEAMQIAAAVADALENAWQAARLIHRNIHPGNIIIKDDGGIQLADLGLARLSDIDANDATFLAGTPNYMPPEQDLPHTEITPAGDIYSLGATLYHMITGKIPFAGMPVQSIRDAHIEQQLPWPRDIETNIPDIHCQFLRNLMMKNPADRIADWNEVYHIALKLAAGETESIELSENMQSTIAPPKKTKEQSAQMGVETQAETDAEQVFEIAGYTILEKIGSGSTATVWRARQESLDRDVAIKVMHPRLWSQMEEADAFLAEAQSVAQLHSRHIIQVYDTGHLDNTAYIVLEYVAGETVAQQLKRDGKMPPRQAMQIAAAIADALGEAWKSTGMIHRDIKPENIIIERDGSIKLADLGLARRADLDTESTDEQSIAGTPNFMSPEQAKGDMQISPTTDIYSLGATLYQMLTGRIPFAGMPVEDILEAQITSQLPWPQDIDSQIPLSYCQFATRLMMKDPADRYQDWTNVYRDAVKLAQGRMMMIKVPSDAKSTIASAGKIPTGHKKVVKIKNRSTSHTNDPIPARPKVPEWLQRTLNLGRAAAIALLLWFLLLQPIFRHWDPTHQIGPDSSEEPATETVTGAPSEPSAEDPYEPYEATVYDDAVPDTADDIPSAPALPPSQQTKQKLLSLLVKQEYDEALTFWEQQKQDVTSTLQRDLISEFMRSENMPQAMIASALQRYTQRPTELQIAGQTISVQIESIDNDTVEAMQYTRSGSSTIMRPITFRISLLPYADQMRLLGETTNPYAPYAEVLIALQGADYETALQSANRVGPLQEVVQHFSQSRIEKLTQL